MTGRWISSFFANRKHWAVTPTGRYPLCGTGGVGWEYDVEHVGTKAACLRCVAMMKARGINVPE